MIAKKNSRFDLESKRSAFFTLGLLVTGSMTLAAFTYSDPMQKADPGRDVPSQLIATYVEVEIPKEKEKEIVQEKPLEVNTSTQASTNVPATVGELILATKSKLPFSSTVTIDVGGMPVGPITTKGTKTIQPVTGEVFDIVDVDAAFVGGTIEMMKFIQANVEYPVMSVEAKEEGKVYVAFVIETDGTVSNIEIERGVSKDLDREAKRVVKSFPKWIPGEKGMQPVRTRVRLPIVFVLK
jgi:protein TonB